MHMHRAIALIIFAAAAVAGGQAQDAGEFQRQRQQMIADFSNFRQGIMANYARFLGEAWDRYQVFSGKKYYPGKKPDTQPRQPLGGDADGGKPTPVQPQQIVKKPTVPAVKPVQPAVVKPAVQSVTFSLYGTRFKAPKITVNQLASMSEADISKCWAALQRSRVYEAVAPSLQAICESGALSDWLAFVAVRKYADALCPGDINTSIVLSHYLLVNMGYDIRLGRTNSQMALLVNFKQMVYARPYITIGGNKYFVFLGETGRLTKDFSGMSSCRLPQDAALGAAVNLVMRPPKLSGGVTQAFHAQASGIEVSGEYDTAIKQIADEYPQTDIPVYAASSLSQQLRSRLIEQIRPQVAGKTEKEAVNQILHFVQNAFKYETDGSQFGYERPFFVEENFIHPANDCEDRAILFAFIIKNVMHLDVHLINYPNHEATAVAFTDQSMAGDGYEYRGKRYLICDPTFIGASLGRCMPQYRSVKPTVQLW